ncbi:YybH family protein [Flagellimonas algicola]|uniref:Nuclear transport factor 2 family protein n=1 Tax=Flagellimonas algicola TaxID=2583815 RepID=A0ABY2WH18_9FLAO|nr:nuclear transport factor 2 family protein [Allomuricauda algicola]TMU50867.1 nuclear transport factor 2 family protein [Allomuricauda algicola]
MNKLFTFLIGALLLCMACNTSQEADKAEIISLLRNQEKAWSNHDLEGFMQTYWKSDSLKFYGANGLTLGWQKTLEGYQKRYPTKDETGTLNFTIDDVTKIESNSYHVMGQYHLKRKAGDADGVFLIILRKIDGEWKIVADMSC